MVRKFEFTSVLGWSVSRWETFSACKRQYYYQYYGKHDRDNLPKINYLKGLTTVPLEIGNVTHKVIEILLKRMQKSALNIDEDKFFEFTKHRMLKILEEKEFAEIYYGQFETVDAENLILPKVTAALRNLLKSERLPWLFEKALATKDEWIIDPEGYGECRIDNQKAYCKVDFLFPIGDEVYILDWKTGKKDDAKHGKQLRGYVAWAYFHFEKEFTKIVPSVAYLLPEYSERSIQVDENGIEAFSDEIRSETEEMYKYCEDVEDNIPLAKVEFPMTENLILCRYCNFRELCDRK
jgi:PD-(D/E)XK nuclease superfamily